MIKKLCVLSVFILMSFTASTSILADLGLDAFNRGDYAAAIQIWESMAKHGDVMSQYKFLPSTVPPLFCNGRFLHFL
jgi:hypothetical protein